MRKFFIIFILITIAFNMISCNSNNLHTSDDVVKDTSLITNEPLNVIKNPIDNTNFEEEDLYQYFRVNKSDGTVLSKFNVTTGKVTPLCSDPLCSHTMYSDCFFTGVSCFYIDEENNIIYTRNDVNNNIQLIKYSISDGNVKILYSGENSNGSRLLNFGYLWVKNEYLNYFYRVNIKNGKYEDLNTEYNIPEAYHDGKFYCTDFDSGVVTEIYTLNSEMKNKEIIYNSSAVISVSFRNIDSGYIFFKDISEGNCRLNVKTGVKEPYTDDYIKTGIIINNMLYYLSLVAKNEQRFLGTCSLNGDKYNIYGGKVYSKDSDNTVELIFDNDDYLFYPPIESVGKYLVINYGAFVIHSTFYSKIWKAKGGGKLVIDTETGKYHMYLNDWDEDFYRADSQ